MDAVSLAILTPQVSDFYARQPEFYVVHGKIISNSPAHPNLATCGSTSFELRVNIGQFKADFARSLNQRTEEPWFTYVIRSVRLSVNQSVRKPKGIY